MLYDTGSNVNNTINHHKEGNRALFSIDSTEAWGGYRTQRQMNWLQKTPIFA